MPHLSGRIDRYVRRFLGAEGNLGRFKTQVKTTFSRMFPKIVTAECSLDLDSIMH